MLGDNIKRYRKDRGFSQEELAIRLHVVRQTVSKWEKHLSVPDAELLQALSRELEVSIPALLGAEEEPTPDHNAIAEQLSRINEQLAVKNRRSRRIWTVIAILLALALLLPVFGAALFSAVPGHAMATSCTLSEDSPYTAEDVEAAFDRCIAYAKKHLKGCELETLVYDEAARPPAADAMVITGRLRAGAHPKAADLEPNQTIPCTFTLTRENGRWEVQEWRPGSQ